MESADPDTDLVKYSNCYHDGLKLQQAGQFSKAIERFDMAYDAITPNGIMTISEGRHCLTARSSCYLALGDHEKAYDDAEESLKEDPKFVKGLLAKAEALYMKGNFEYALVFYHRGHALRPELTEFTLGISKSTEAIENSVGTADQIDLEKTKDLTLFQNFQEIGVTGKPPKKSLAKPRKTKQQGTVKPSEKTVKQLLGELYSDRQYLEELLEDPAFVTFDTKSGSGGRDESISGSLKQGLKYLDKRAEFWRQQKPIYARAKDVERMTMRTDMLSTKATKATVTKRKTEEVPTVQVTSRHDALTMLETCQNALDGRDYGLALDSCDRLMEVLSTTVVYAHESIEAAMNSVKGDAYFALHNYDQAVAHFENELTIGTSLGSSDICERALSKLGRTHAAMEDYGLAIKLVSRVESKDPEQSVWKEHELGRYHLELFKKGVHETNKSDGDVVEVDHGAAACEHGQAAVDLADSLGDTQWSLQATTLLAQAQIATEDNASAFSTYRKALEIAKEYGNEDVIGNIEGVLDDMAEKASQELGFEPPA